MQVFYIYIASILQSKHQSIAKKLHLPNKIIYDDLHPKNRK
jgi:hypothetical protein